MAGEGLVKKAGILSQEVEDLREERKSLIEDEINKRERLKELELCLSSGLSLVISLPISFSFSFSLSSYFSRTLSYLSGRSLRLKEMHENVLFKRAIKQLEARMLAAEEDDRMTQRKLLAKIQELETVTSFNDNQRRTFDAQSEEIAALAREVLALRENQSEMLEHSRKLEHVATLCASERDAFEVSILFIESLTISIISTHVIPLVGSVTCTVTLTYDGHILS
jgi:myosin heavy subunit